MTMNDSGVSETVGFVIILGILIAGMAMVTLYGYPALIQEQQNANFRNMQRGMISLQSEIKSLAYKNVPYRETTLQIAGGTMLVRKDPLTSAAYFEISNGTGNLVPRFYPGQLIYNTDDGKGAVILENGAVLQRFVYDPNGSSMLAEPRFVYDVNSSTLIIPLIKINATEDFSKAGFSVLEMKLQNYTQEQFTDPGMVEIKYHAYAEDNHNIAWRDYLSKPSLYLSKVTGVGKWDGFTSTFSHDFSGTPGGRVIINTFNVTILGM